MKEGWTSADVQYGMRKSYWGGRPNIANREDGESFHCTKSLVAGGLGSVAPAQEHAVDMVPS